MTRVLLVNRCRQIPSRTPTASRLGMSARRSPPDLTSDSPRLRRCFLQRSQASCETQALRARRPCLCAAPSPARGEGAREQHPPFLARDELHLKKRRVSTVKWQRAIWLRRSTTATDPVSTKKLPRLHPLSVSPGLQDCKPHLLLHGSAPLAARPAATRLFNKHEQQQRGNAFRAF